MKNLRTPRTLAECEFTVGHSSARPQGRRGFNPDTLVGIAVTLLGVIGLIVSH